MEEKDNKNKVNDKSQEEPVDPYSIKPTRKEIRNIVKNKKNRKILWGSFALIVFFLISFVFIMFESWWVRVFNSDYFGFCKSSPQWCYYQWQVFLSGVGLIVGVIYAAFIFSKKVVRIRRRGRKILAVILILMGGYTILRTFVFQSLIMNNDGLKPYLSRGKYSVYEQVDKSVKKGDIIAIEGYNGIIASVAIGVPGDKIELRKGRYFVNGKPLQGISYNLGQVNGIDGKTPNCFVIVPSSCFFGTPTYDPIKNTPNIDLNHFIYRKSDIIGKLFFPKPEVHIKRVSM